MRSEEEIVRQIKLFHQEWSDNQKLFNHQSCDDHELVKHNMYHRQAIEREIEALEWVLGYHVEWPDD